MICMQNSVSKIGNSGKTRVNVITSGNSIVVLVLNPAGGLLSYTCPKNLKLN